MTLVSARYWKEMACLLTNWSALRVASTAPRRPLRLSKTLPIVAGEKYGFDNTIYDLTDVGPSLGQALRRDDLDSRAREVIDDIVNADVLIIGAPTYKGSLSRPFKHLIDLIDPHELRAKPIIITATGGGDRHALMVEHQLRPLFGFFMSHTLADRGLCVRPRLHRLPRLIRSAFQADRRSHRRARGVLSCRNQALIAAE